MTEHETQQHDVEEPAAQAGPAPGAPAGGAEPDGQEAPPAAAGGAEPDGPPAPAGAEAATAAAEELDPLATAEARRDEYLALAQRTQADFDNYRKRMARENAAALQRGVHKLAKELLGALDHFDLALAAARSAGGAEDVVKGFEAIRAELATALGRAGIESFSPKGEAFDPTLHEAMVQQPVEGAESGTVVEVYQQGYKAGEHVLRPARVVVAA